MLCCRVAALLGARSDVPGGPWGSSLEAGRAPESGEKTGRLAGRLVEKTGRLAGRLVEKTGRQARQSGREGGLPPSMEPYSFQVDPK